MKEKSYRFIFTMYFVMFGIIITGLSTFISYKVHIVDIDKTIRNYAEEVSANKINEYIRPNIERMDEFTIALANNTTLLAYIKKPHATALRELQNTFLTMASSDKNVMQVRYINASGKEIVRINRDNQQSIPYIVKPQQLQDKSHRDYFVVVKNMDKAQLWHSKIDLNIENGKVEIPYRPTMRIAMPIFQKGEFKGVVILNILLEKLLHSMELSPIFNIFIIDKNGNYILHPDDRYSFNSYKGVTRELYEDFSTDASRILEGKLKSSRLFAYSLSHIIRNGDEPILILQAKKTLERSLELNNFTVSTIVALLSILISIPLAMYLAKAPSNLQQKLFDANKELKRFNYIIDRYVITARTNISGIITDVSNAFCSSSGYTKEELIGNKMSIISHPDTANSVFKNLWNTILQGKEWNDAIKNKKKNGEAYWLDQMIIPIKDEKENILSFMSVGSDITAKKELEIISTTDKLTRLYNRRKLDEHLLLEIEKSNRSDNIFSIIIIDIDHFKKVNDTYGHLIGDEVLKSVARILQNSVRKVDIVGRWGGEEFMVICPHTHKEGALQLAEILRQNIEQSDFETVSHITISLGVATYIPQEKSDAMLKRADGALYMAKENGRNQARSL